MSELAGKRLLLLGGSSWKDAIRQYGEECGIELLAAGNSPKSAYFEIASESYPVDTTDEKAMTSLLESAGVDGVYLGGTEPVIAAAAGYLAEMGYPCYCSSDQFRAFSDKSAFKGLCIAHGLPVLPRLSEEEALAIVEERPVVTKPVDGSGSRGFSVCHDADELAAGIEKAREHSLSNEAMIEELGDNDSVVVFYTFCGGEVIYSGLEDKYPVRHEGQSSYVGGLHVFESEDADRFRYLYEGKLTSMFSDARLKEGSIWIEAFRSGDGFVFNEAGYRYGGSMSMYPISYFHGINQVAMDIHYSLTGAGDVSAGGSLIPRGKHRGRYYCMYPVHLSCGTIAEVSGLERLRSDERIVVVPTTKTTGARVEGTGDIGQVFAYAHFTCDDIDECKEVIDFVHGTLNVRDDSGENMVVRLLDLDDGRVRL